MRSIHALAIVLALVAPLATAAGPSAEPVLGRGLGLPEPAADARELTRPSPGSATAGATRSFGIGYGRLRGAGSGIRISTMADSAFGPSGARPAPAAGPGDRRNGESARP